MIVDSHTIRFNAKTIHWQNLGAAGGFQILPKHVFEKLDFNKINFDFPVVSGPFRLGRVEEGIFVDLERRKDWWASEYKRHRAYTISTGLSSSSLPSVKMRWKPSKRGSVDIYPVNTARFWVKETKGEKFEKNWIVKQKIYNHQISLQFQGFAMNMRKPPSGRLEGAPGTGDAGGSAQNEPHHHVQPV